MSFEQGNVMGTVDDQLNRENRTGKLVRIEDGDWVNASSAIAIHQMMERTLDRDDSGTRDDPPVNDEGTLRVNEAFEQADRAQELIFESQFEDLRFTETTDEVFDAGIKNGSNLVIRVVPEEQDLDGSWHRVARTWMNQTEGIPKNLSFSKFSVQSLNEPDQERYQIVQTFGGDLIYGFGRQPRIMMLTGNVLNGKMKVQVGDGQTRSMDWKNALQRNYDEYYRLTRCIENKQKIIIHAEHTVYSGYLLNMQTFTNAETQAMSQVTMSFIIEEKQFGRVNDNEIPGRLNESGRVVTDQNVPEEYLKDARVEDYLEKNLVPLVKRQINGNNQRKKELAEEIKRLLPIAATTEEIIERSTKVGPDDYYTPFPDFRTHKLFDTDIIPFPENNTNDIGQNQRKLNELMFEFIKKFGKKSDVGNLTDQAVSNFAKRESGDIAQEILFENAYQQVYTQQRYESVSDEITKAADKIEKLKTTVQKHKNSVAKQLKEANNLASKLARSQSEAETNEKYLQALSGT